MHPRNKPANIDVTPSPAHPLVRVGADASGTMPSVGYLLSAAGAGLGAYHGYKRNEGSVGWAIGWGLLGGMFPIITTGVAFAQGFGEPSK